MTMTKPGGVMPSCTSGHARGGPLLGPASFEALTYFTACAIRKPPCIVGCIFGSLGDQMDALVCKVTWSIMLIARHTV